MFPLDVNARRPTHDRVGETDGSDGADQND